MGIVAKFGGSSVKNAQAIERCTNIVANFPEMEVIVVSATYQTTNKLENLTPELLDELQKHHKNMAFYLDLEKDIHQKLDDIYDQATAILNNKENVEEKEWQDQLYAIGELWSSWLFFGSIRKSLPDRKVEWLDAREIIKTDSTFGCSVPNSDTINSKLKYLDQNTLYITQGFIGSDDQGKPTTLGREGSDYTATLIAAGIKSEAVIIWTDVPGIATIDPRIEDQAIFIPQMNYKMATTMAQHGAKVLFEKTLEPVSNLKIPVFVKSSLEPDLPGTCISSQASEGNFGFAINNNFVTFVCDNAEAIEMDGIIERGDNFIVFEADDPIDLAITLHRELLRDTAPTN